MKNWIFATPLLVPPSKVNHNEKKGQRENGLEMWVLKTSYTRCSQKVAYRAHIALSVSKCVYLHLCLAAIILCLHILWQNWRKRRKQSKTSEHFFWREGNIERESIRSSASASLTCSKRIKDFVYFYSYKNFLIFWMTYPRTWDSHTYTHAHIHINANTYVLVHGLSNVDGQRIVKLFDCSPHTSFRHLKGNE